MLEIGEQTILKRLTFENPWWALDPNKGNIKFRQPAKRHFYDAFHTTFFSADTGKATLLAGPLRTGKTVMLRQMIAELIEGGIKPQSVLFASFVSPTYWAKSLGEMLTMFRQKFGHSEQEPLYIFLDEVQYTGEWREELKALATNNPTVRFAAALSSDVPLGKYAGKGAGEDDRDFELSVLPPLTFVEFLRLRGSEEKLFEHVVDDAPQEFHQQHLKALNEEFVRYVNYGGFPEGIMTRTEGTPPPTFVRDGLCDRLLHKDLASHAGINDVHELSRLFTVVAFNTAREISIDELAQSSGIAKNTVRKYLDYLESSFLIRRVVRLDRDAKRFKRIVAFKVYLTSPCMYAALFGPVGADSEVFGRLAETAVFCQWLGSESVGHMAYASWRGGKVDMVGIERRGNSPIRPGRPWVVAEMDWNERLIYSQAGPRALGEFVRTNCPEAVAYVMTRNVARPGLLDGIQVRVLPIALSCYLLHKDVMARTTRILDEEAQNAESPLVLTPGKNAVAAAQEI